MWKFNFEKPKLFQVDGTPSCNAKVMYNDLCANTVDTSIKTFTQNEVDVILYIITFLKKNYGGNLNVLKN